MLSGRAQTRMGGRVVDGSGLENRQGATPRGFESHPIRQDHRKMIDFQITCWLSRSFAVRLVHQPYTGGRFSLADIRAHCSDTAASTSERGFPRDLVEVIGCQGIKLALGTSCSAKGAVAVAAALRHERCPRSPREGPNCGLAPSRRCRIVTCCSLRLCGFTRSISDPSLDVTGTYRARHSNVWKSTARAGVSPCVALLLRHQSSPRAAIRSCAAVVEGWRFGLRAATIPVNAALSGWQPRSGAVPPLRRRSDRASHGSQGRDQCR